VRVPQVGLAVFHASEDAQAWEGMSALPYAVQIPGHVQAWGSKDPVRADEWAEVINHVPWFGTPPVVEVQMLGEDHGW